MNCLIRRPRFASACCAVAVAALGCLPVAAKSGTDPELPGEVLLRLRSTADLQPLLVKYSLSLRAQFGSRPIYRLSVVGATAAHDVIGALELEPAVLGAEPNVIHSSPEARKNSPWAIGTQGAYVAQWAPQAMRLPQAHALSQGAGVRVAVLDTGVDAKHPDLAGRLLPGFDFVDFDNDPSEAGSAADVSFGHGTHVAGLVALVAPDARIMPLRILDADGVGNAWVLAEAMLHAVDPDGNPTTDDGAHVINLSISSLAKTDLFKTVAKLVSCKKRGLGGKDADDDDDGDDAAVSFSDKVRCSGFGGAVVVAAAGNRGSDRIREYPAAEASSALLSVAASDKNGWLATFSNYGWVKLAAPGEDLTSTIPGGGYGTWSGTSMAAPLASGTAALLRSANRRLSVDQVVNRLKDRGSRLCGTPTKELDAWAVLVDEATRNKPGCDARRN